MSKRLVFTILGVDIGSYAVKTSTGIIFESKIFKGKNLLSKGIKIYYNNEYYTIGEGARDTDIDKSKRANNLLLLYTAIALSTTEEDINIKLVLGLPIGQFQMKAALFKEYILNNKFAEFKLIYNDRIEERIINIEDVEIYPEGVASVPDNFNGIILDIGGRTIDICLLKNNKIEKPISIPEGTINLYSKMINSLNKLYTLDLDIADIDRILENGLYIEGEKVDESIIYQELSTFTDELINKLNLEYSLKTNRLFVTGGGGDFFYNSIRRRVKHAEIAKNPIFSNAKGYYQYGLSIWGDE